MRHDAHPDLVSALFPIADLALFWRNAREGDIGMISQSLKRNGQFRSIVVNRGTKTGRPNEILAGNHTAQAAKALGWTHIAVSWVDVSDDDATRIVLADNRANDLSTNNDAILASLLTHLPDLEGTGFDGDDLDQLLAELDGPPLGEDDAEDGEGSDDPDEFIVIAVRVPATVRDTYKELLEQLEGHEHQRFASILRAASKALGGA